MLQLDSMKDASSKVEEMNKRMTEYREVIEDLEKQLQSVQKERADLEMTVASYKQKCVLRTLYDFYWSLLIFCFSHQQATLDALLCNKN